MSLADSMLCLVFRSKDDKATRHLCVRAWVKLKLLVWHTKKKQYCVF